MPSKYPYPMPLPSPNILARSLKVEPHTWVFMSFSLIVIYGQKRHNSIATNEESHSFPSAFDIVNHKWDGFFKIILSALVLSALIFRLNYKSIILYSLIHADRSFCEQTHRAENTLKSEWTTSIVSSWIWELGLPFI